MKIVKSLVLVLLISPFITIAQEHQGKHGDMKKAIKELDLTEEQQEELKVLKKKQHEEMTSLKERHRKEMEAVLTPEQVAK